MNEIISKLAAAMRWRLAQFLDKKPDVCWAAAVMWARFPGNHPLNEVFELRHTAGRCEAGGDLPYCGKCAVLANK